MVLEFDRLEKYPCPLIENLVRVGNVHPENPHHFWNALFYAFKAYRSMSTPERWKYIEHQRETIADRMNRKEWLAYTDGFHAQRIILRHFKTRFLDNRLEHDLAKDVQIVLRIIPDRDAFLELVLHELGSSPTMPQEFLQAMSRTYSLALKDVEVRESKSIPMEKRVRCEQVFIKFVHEVWHASTEEAFQEFVEDVRNPQAVLPFFMVPFLLKYLDFHVFFLDHRTHDILSLNESYETDLRQRSLKHAVLVLYDGKTFESLGVARIVDDESTAVEESMDHEKVETDTVVSKSKRCVRILRLLPMTNDIAQICYKRLIQ